MQSVRSKGTRCEMEVRRAVHALGLRYRVDQRPVPELNRRADLVFGRPRVAVFVDGCFWHGCPEHGQRQHSVNGWYWPDKIGRNIERDRDTNAQLSHAGWLVVRVWEHEDAAQAASRIAEAIRSRAVLPVGVERE
ncbi:MAG: very short patch repair endonuclease [Acidimicrobiales bacterium]